jgi:hypothetical protein
MRFKGIALLAGVALAAIAFAVPAAAQAEVTLTEEGKPLKPGAVVTATNSRWRMTAGIGTTSCQPVTMRFEVESSGPKHVVLVPLGELEVGKCFASWGLEPPTTVTNLEIAENLTIDTWGTGEAVAKFDWSVYFDEEHESLWTRCHYTGFVRFQGNESGTDILNMESPFGGSGPICPASANFAVAEGTVTLETKDGTQLELDFVKTE